MSSEYDAPRYWDAIFDSAYDESAVGYPHLARALNKARYDVERRNVGRALDAAGVPAPDRALDVGSGTGIWIDFWRRRGARDLTGADLTKAAVEHLRTRYPEYEFLQRDVGDADARLPEGLDVVSAMSVLLHITDEQRFEVALRNLARCVRGGGHIVLVEPVVVHRWWGAPFGPEANSKARPLHTYAGILASEGFKIVTVRPASCILTNVMDTRSSITFKVLERYWDLLMRVVGRRERLGQAVASVLRPIDLLLTRIVPNGPSAKIVLARRVEPTPIPPQ